jgi:hypothetical protein
MRSIIGVNSKGSDILLGDEIRVLSVEKKQELLHNAGVQMEMLPMQGLAIKSMLAIPWYRLRILRRYMTWVHMILHGMKNKYIYRWLKQAGVYIGSERKERVLAHECIGDNLMVELAPFSFKLPAGGEELRGAAYGYTPSLTQKIIQLLEQNERSV